MVAARLEDVQEAGDVGADVLVRVGQRVPHARLRGEVDDAVEAVAREQAFDRRAVGDVELLEREAGPPQLLSRASLRLTS